MPFCVLLFGIDALLPKINQLQSCLIELVKRKFYILIISDKDGRWTGIQRGAYLIDNKCATN